MLNDVTDIKNTDLVHRMNAVICTMSQSGRRLAAFHRAPPFSDLVYIIVIKFGTETVPPGPGTRSITDSSTSAMRWLVFIRVIIRVGEGGV